jgi:hypothetical protein
MIAPHVSLLRAAAVAVALGSLFVPVPAAARQGPGRPPARIAPSLDAVLPMLDKAVVRVRSGQANLTGLRLRDDLVVVAVPGSAPLPTSLEVGVFGTWAPAPVVGSDAAQRLVLVKAGPRPGSGPVPALKVAAPALPGFLVRASSAGDTLDVQTVWVDALDGADVPDGGWVFGTDGSLAGLGASRGGKTTILPAAGVLAAANALAATR